MTEYNNLLALVLEIEGYIRIVEARNDSVAKSLLLSKIDQLKAQAIEVCQDKPVTIPENTIEEEPENQAEENHEVSSQNIEEDIIVNLPEEDLIENSEAEDEDIIESAEETEDIVENPEKEETVGRRAGVFFEIDESQEDSGSTNDEMFAQAIEDYIPAINNTPSKPSAPLQMRVEDVISHRELSDFAKAFTINDKFRFTRELFNNDSAQFTESINRLNNMQTLDEAYDYFLNDLGWDADKEAVSEFIALVASHFNALS